MNSDLNEDDQLAPSTSQQASPEQPITSEQINEEVNDVIINIEPVDSIVKHFLRSREDEDIPVAGPSDDGLGAATGVVVAPILPEHLMGPFLNQPTTNDNLKNTSNPPKVIKRPNSKTVKHQDSNEEFINKVESLLEEGKVVEPTDVSDTTNYELIPMVPICTDQVNQDNNQNQPNTDDQQQAESSHEPLSEGEDDIFIQIEKVFGPSEDDG